MKNVYSIYDEKAMIYNTPFFMRQDGEAVRAFQGEVNSNQDGMIRNNPEDFVLYRMGHYDELKGRIVGTQTPELIVRGSQVKEME